MPRETLIAILERAARAETPGTRYRPRDDHDLTVHFGEPSRAMTVDHVVGMELAASHVEVEIRDRGILYAPYEAVHAVVSVPTRAKRAGGSLGF